MAVGEVESVNSLIASRTTNYTNSIVISRPSLLDFRENQGFKG